MTFSLLLFQKELRHDSSRGGVAIVTDKTNPVTSTSLLLRQVRLSDSGKYSCTPSNADPASVTLHVLQGLHLSLFVFLVLLLSFSLIVASSFLFFCYQVNGRLQCKATREFHRIRSALFSRFFRLDLSGSIIAESLGSRDHLQSLCVTSL